ncbi:transmembrane protein 214-A [Bacillus rossius redtenbacheri]|uniref:transmembrane protein 214-A n=1 Tax=Bacillus rossius redtenbacheri TaxID=93214 RepID=UPI002FDD08BA
MSGQWEVVVKNKQKHGGNQAVKKLTKNERKKFVENAPKVEDILPLDQVKSLYNSLDNKENRKPVQKDSQKDNEAKKTQKKQQPEKKKEVKEKSPVPKSLESAASQIDVKELSSELGIGQARFPDAPLAWLKGLAEYLNAKLDHTSPATSRSTEYPLCALPHEVRQVALKALQAAGEATARHFYEMCLVAMASDMSKGNMPIFGYKVLLQLLAFQNPEITVHNIPKIATIRNSYQNRQPIGLAILWAVGQGGVKNLSVGLKVWQEIMLPVLEMKNYSSAVVGYLRDILNSKSNTKPLSPDQFFTVYDVIHSPKPGLPNTLRQELLGVSGPLRAQAFQKDPEKRLQSFFQPLLERLRPSASKELKEELLNSLVLCLTKDQQSFSIWRQLYTKNLAQSAVLLKHLDSRWESLKAQLPLKTLWDTLTTFKVTNDELRKMKHKEDHLQDCQKYSEELLKKMTVSRSFPWKLGSFFLLLIISALLAYDVQKHGTFKSSSTGSFLKDIGALKYGEHAWARTKYYSQKSYQWAEVNVPHYYSIAVEQAKPYLQQAWDFSIVLADQLYLLYGNIKVFLEEKTPLVVNWVNHFAPGLLEIIKSHSVTAWEAAKHYAFVFWQYVLEYSQLFLKWTQQNVFVGSLSPENLQRYSEGAINTTQVYATWTYDWLLQKVQTLSKIKSV